MPIGSGGLDGEGVWQFGEDDDAGGLASDLWNLLGESVSAQFAVDRASLDNLAALIATRSKWASYRTSALAIGNSSFTTVTYTNSASVRDGAVTSQATGGHLIAATGLYSISAAVMWAGSALGNRAIRIRNGSTTLIESLIQSFDTNGRGQTLILPAIPLSAGDSINMQVFQNSGGGLDLTHAQLVIERA